MIRSRGDWLQFAGASSASSSDLFAIFPFSSEPESRKMALFLVFAPLSRRLLQALSMKEHKTNIILLAACVAVCLGIFAYRQTIKRGSAGKSGGSEMIGGGEVPNGYNRNDAALDVIIGKVRGLRLSTEERLELRRIYGKWVEARVGRELTLCSVREATPDDNIVEIQAYTSAGEEFKQSMFDEMRRVLGDERMSQVVRQAGPVFDAQNNFWGKYPQSLLISRDHKTNSYKVVHTINPGVDEGFKRTTISNLVERMLLGYEPYRQFLPGKR
jgi:hypothetical protein